MARRLQLPSWRLLVPAVGLLLVTGLTTALSRAGGLVVHQCVPEGSLGWLGVRLALLRADAVCPTGALAVGGDQRQVIAVVVGFAVPVVAAHVAGAFLGIGVLAHLRRLALAVVGVLAGSAPLPDDVAPLPSGFRAAVAGRHRRPVVRNAPLVPWWRGPPALQLA